MKRYLIALSIFLTSCHHDHPNPPEPPVPIPPALEDTGNMGQGYYGFFHDKWPCQDSYDAFAGKDHIRIATLWDTFRRNPKADPNNDPSLACLIKFNQDPRFDYFESHLINEVCERNQRCQFGTDFLYGISVSDYKKKIKARDPVLMKRIQAQATDFMARVASKLRPDVKCKVSMGLESNLDGPTMRIVLDSVASIIGPRCTYVSSPGIPGIMREAHGADPGVNPPCLVNLDGADINFVERPTKATTRIDESKLPAYNQKFLKCESNFLWVKEYNGLPPDNSWGPPVNRTNWPSKKILSLTSKYLHRY